MGKSNGEVEAVEASHEALKVVRTLRSPPSAPSLVATQRRARSSQALHLRTPISCCRRSLAWARALQVSGWLGMTLDEALAADGAAQAEEADVPRPK